MNQEFILWQKPGHIFPYKSLSNICMPNPIYKGLSSAPQILPASNLLRRDGRTLNVRLLWETSDPVPRAMGAGAVPRGAQLCQALDESPLRKPTRPALRPLPAAPAWRCITWVRPGRRDVPGPAVSSAVCQPAPCLPHGLARRGPRCLEVGLGGPCPRVLIVTSPNSGRT